MTKTYNIGRSESLENIYQLTCNLYITPAKHRHSIYCFSCFYGHLPLPILRQIWSILLSPLSGLHCPGDSLLSAFLAHCQGLSPRFSHYPNSSRSMGHSVMLCPLVHPCNVHIRSLEQILAQRLQASKDLNVLHDVVQYKKLQHVQPSLAMHCKCHSYKLIKLLYSRPSTDKGGLCKLISKYVCLADMSN